MLLPPAIVIVPLDIVAITPAVLPDNTTFCGPGWIVCAGNEAEAVNVLPFSPKLTLLLLLNTKFVKLFDVVPPDKLIADNNPAVDGTV